VVAVNDDVRVQCDSVLACACVLAATREATYSMRQ
jgi:hypothetical protein